MPECHKCNNIFPNRLKIDGKFRNLQNRKYCLECSPYGFHNTKQIHDTDKRKCLFCSCDVPKNKHKWCTEKCRSKYRYQNNRPEFNKRMSIRNSQRRKEYKKKLVDFMGGKCIECGYNKNIKALTFHHPNRYTKTFNIGKHLHNTSLEVLIEETKGCELLCIRCHLEKEEKLQLNYDYSQRSTDSNRYELNKIRAVKRKQSLIILKGGCCYVCGYNKCQRTLCFAYKDPKQKLFQMDARNIGNRSFKSLLLEIEKCELICILCHTEKQYPESQILIT